MITGLQSVLPTYFKRCRFDAPKAWMRRIERMEPNGPPEWQLSSLAASLGLPKPVTIAHPGPGDFPLLVHHAELGWAIADRAEHGGALRVVRQVRERAAWPAAECCAFALDLPGRSGEDAETSSARIFIRALLRRRRMLAEAALATAVISVINLATSLYSMQVYDRVIPHHGLSTLWVLTAGVGVALVFDFILRATRSLMLDRDAAAIDGEVSELLFRRASEIRLDARPPGVGSMAAQLRGVEQVRSLMCAASLFVLADLPFALFFIFVLGQIGGLAIALVPTIGLVVALTLGFWFALAIRAATAKVQAGSNLKNGLLVEALDAAETLKSTNAAWELLGRWSKLVKAVNRDDEGVKRWSTLAHTSANLLQQVTYVAIVAIGSIQVVNGHLTMGGLIACSILSGRVAGPLTSQLPALIVQASYARAALQGLDQILTAPRDRSWGVDPIFPANLTGPLRAEGVVFTYPGSRQAIQVPALEFRPGERVSIIGAIGSGKSTLLKLLSGLYRPAGGAVMLAGLDVSQIVESALRDHLAYLPQEYRLINGTLRDNLTLGRPDLQDEEILEVANELGLSALIASHPSGLDLPITEGGRGLSGGQRQLVGVCRLLLGGAKVWLLDEPTAALDENTEVKVLQALMRRAPADGIVVVVTHKLKLIGLTQRLLFMNEGKVALDGPPAAVLQRLGLVNAAQTPTAA